MTEGILKPDEVLFLASNWKNSVGTLFAVFNLLFKVQLAQGTAYQGLLERKRVQKISLAGFKCIFRSPMNTPMGVWFQIFDPSPDL